jgi:hypothetical protein
MAPYVLYCTLSFFLHWRCCKVCDLTASICICILVDGWIIQPRCCSPYHQRWDETTIYVLSGEEFIVAHDSAPYIFLEAHNAGFGSSLLLLRVVSSPFVGCTCLSVFTTGVRMATRGLSEWTQSTRWAGRGLSLSQRSRHGARTQRILLREQRF